MQPETGHMRHARGRDQGGIDVHRPMARTGPAGRVRSGASRASAAVLAAAPLLAVACLLGVPSAARAQTTLVSNLNQTPENISTSVRIAQRFTTGSDAGGYALGSVDISMGTIPAGVTLAAAIYETDAFGYPTTTEVHALTAPSAFTSISVLTFTAPANAQLEPSKTYAVVFQPSATITFARTQSDAEDEAQTGWSIANAYSQLFNGNWQHHSSRSLRIAVRGPAASDPEVSVTAGAAVTEGGDATFTVTASPAPSSALTVNLTVSQTGDFVASADLGSKTVSVPASGSATYTVATEDDSADEANGSVKVEVATGTGYTVHATNSSASVTVNDNDDAPTPQTDSTLVSNIMKSSGGNRLVGSFGGFQFTQAQPFTAGDNENGYTLTAVVLKVFSEGDAADVPRVSIYTDLSGEPGAVLYELANPTVFGNGNMTFTAPANATLAKGTDYFVVVEEETASTWRLDSTDSDDVDTAESGWDIGEQSVWRNQDDGDWDTTDRSLLLTIKGTLGTASDPEVSVTAGAAVTEGGDATFTVTASPAPASALTVNLTVSQTGDFVASADLGSKTVSVPTTGSATYTVATVDDSADEANGAVTVAVAAGTGYTVHATNSSASVTVNDNDDAPTTPTDSTLVSNIMQSSGGNRAVGTSGTFQFTQAQPFTAGDNENGYTLTAVVLKVDADANLADVPRVSIYTDMSGEPGVLLYELANPAVFANGNMTFTAPDNATLAKETNYFVVVEETVGIWRIDSTNSNDVDTAESGWDIGNEHFWRNQDGGTWDSNSRSLLITIKGTVPPPITIASEHDSYGGGIEDVVFTLTRDGSTTDELDATVAITQDEAWLTDLSHEVTFAAGLDTTSLTLAPRDVSLAPTATGDLTATVGGNSKTVEIISIAEPPVTIGYDKTAYSFPEETAKADVEIYAVATLNEAYPRPPDPDIVALSTDIGTALNGADEDYLTVALQVGIEPYQQENGIWVARLLITSGGAGGIELVNDDVYEGDEHFNLFLETAPGLRDGWARFANPDGTYCLPLDCRKGAPYKVTITDEADLPSLSLGVLPATIAEEDDPLTTAVDETVSTVTARITNSKTFADTVTLTLTFGGTATAGTHYAVSPADEDDTAAGHQISLPAGGSLVQLTVTATSNDTKDGDRTVEITGSRDGTMFSATRTITIDDDEDTSTSPTITIASEHDSYGGGIEDVVFTLTRDGSTTDALDATVAITQDEAWLTDLSHEVTFAAGLDTTSLTLAQRHFSFAPTAKGDLTATVGGNSKTVEIISIAEPPVTIGYDTTAYSFPEETAQADVEIYAVATLNAAYPRPPDEHESVAVTAETGTAMVGADKDYRAVSQNTEIKPYQQENGIWVARYRLVSAGADGLRLVNDDAYEGDEHFSLFLETNVVFRDGWARFANPDGTYCIPLDCRKGAPYKVTITDEADLPSLSLGVLPATIAEEDDPLTTAVDETVSTVTARITNSKTFADAVTLTLTFGGTATAGTHYAVSPADEDGTAAGHQISLPAGDSLVQLTVTATSNDTNDGDRTVTVAGSRDGTAFGTTRTITIADDEDVTPVVSVAAGDAVTEGGDASFTVTASPAPSSALTVNLTVSQTGSFVAAGNLGSKTVSVPATGSATYTVATVDDGADEAHGSVKVAVAAGTGYTVHATNSTASVTVNDNDTPAVTGTTLVSNTGRSTAGGITLSDLDRAQGFTAGTNVTVSSIQIGFNDVSPGAGTLTVTLNSEAVGGGPGSAIATLTNPASLTAQALNTFTDPANTALTSGQTYFVVLSYSETTGGPRLRVTTADAEDSGGVAGWSIANSRHQRNKGSGSWSSHTNAAQIGVNGDADDTNSAPVFDEGATATRSLAEDIGVNTRPTTENLGDPFTATDADGDTLTYSLTGDFRFSVHPQTGQLRASGGHFDYESQASWEVTVKVEDGNGGSATIDVTINVTDEDEPPTKPFVQTVSAAGATSLSVTWDAPFNDRRPEITGYDLQYRQGTSGGWSDGPEDVTGTSATISGLAAGTSYQVRVRASNDEGDGPWSEPGSGSTDTTADPKVTLQLTQGEVTEGDTVRILLNIAPASTSQLAVRMSWSQTGSFWAATPPSRVTVPAGTDELELEVRTVDDNTQEANGSITARVLSGTGYEVRDDESVTVVVQDNDSSAGICRRTAQVRERILLRLKRLHGYDGDCSGVTDADLAKLTHLDLDGEGITSLRAGDFAGLSSVTNLSLSVNRLSSLPAGIFGGLDALDELRLSDNRLSSLRAGVFVDLPELRKLVLLGNNLNDLPFDDLEALPSLTDLYWNGNPGFGYGVQVFPLRVTVAGSSAGEYRVRLKRPPSGEVKIARHPPPAGVSVSPSSQTFTRNDWFRSRAFTVRSTAAVGETRHITHHVASGYFPAGAIDSVAVTKVAADMASSSEASDPVESSEDADLALVAGLSPGEAAAVLFGEAELDAARLEALDRLGNGNGRYDLGDALSWIERCRRGEADCGGTSTDTGPAGGAALPAAARGGGTSRRTGGRAPGPGTRPRVRRARRRRRRGPVPCALALLLAAAWSCTDGPVGPAPPAAAVPDPGFLTVEWTPPEGSRDIGVLLELEGPGIEAVRAPVYELYESAPGERHRIVVAGELEAGPLVRFRVPDRNRLAEYRVRVVEVTDEDYGLGDAGRYGAVIRPR